MDGGFWTPLNALEPQSQKQVWLERRQLEILERSFVTFGT